MPGSLPQGRYLGLSADAVIPFLPPAILEFSTVVSNHSPWSAPSCWVWSMEKKWKCPGSMLEALPMVLG